MQQPFVSSRPVSGNFALAGGPGLACLENLALRAKSGEEKKFRVQAIGPWHEAPSLQAWRVAGFENAIGRKK